MPAGVEEDSKKQVDFLRSSVEQSSNENRNLLIYAVLFFSYIFITVLGTTDMKLLLPEGKITLPLIGADLPILTFYWLISLVVVVFHVNLLANLYFHSKKLNEWLKTGSENIPHFRTQYLYSLSLNSK